MAKKKTKTDPQASAVPQPKKPAARAAQGEKAATKGKRGQAPDASAASAASTATAATATAPEANGTTTAAPRRRAGRGQAKPKKLSALDAAAQVLDEAGTPMTCQEMIAAMTEKGYWSSPKGRTPAATLYSAILRELKTKAEAARFCKTERGRFARTTPA